MSLSIPKEFNYFAARWLQSDNLQVQVQAALDKLNKIGRRRQTLDKSGNNRRVINKPLKSNGMLVGTLVKYIKGNNQAVIADVEDDDEAEELEVMQMAPPKSEPGKRNEFLESVLYFGIFNNHVIVVQSAALKGKQLAEHLNWLMEKVTPEGSIVRRVDLIPRPKLSLQKKKVNKITFRDPLKVATKQESPSQLEQPSSEIVMVNRSGDGEGRANRVLRSILEATGRSTIDFKDALDDGDIEIEVKISYKKKGKNENSEMLDGIVAALGDQLDEHTVLDVAGMGEVRGDSARLHDTFYVHAPGGLAFPPDVYKKMHEWLIGMLERGTIKAEA